MADCEARLFDRPLGEPICGLPSLLTVCVDQQSNFGSYSGRLYHCGLPEPYYFCDYGDMLVRADLLLDEFSGPQAAMERRNLSGKRPEYQPRKKQEPEIYHTVVQLAREKGKLFQFYIYVTFRCNASWQGRLSLPKSKEQLHFRSVLELLHLLSQYGATRQL